MGSMVTSLDFSGNLGEAGATLLRSSAAKKQASITFPGRILGSLEGERKTALTASINHTLVLNSGCVPEVQSPFHIFKLPNGANF